MPQVLALVKNSAVFAVVIFLQFDEAVASIKEALQEAERVAGCKIKQVILGVGGATLESKLLREGLLSHGPIQK